LAETPQFSSFAAFRRNLAVNPLLTMPAIHGIEGAFVTTHQGYENLRLTLAV
jgi:hypothetical protein